MPFITQNISYLFIQNMIRTVLNKQQGTPNNQITQTQNIQQSVAWRRVQTDQQEIQLDIPPQIQVKWPDPSDIMKFEVIIKPDENLWKSGQFPFSLQVPEDYPMQAPKVLCKKKIFHPNIDLDGKVCLNILREDWKPVSSLKDVLFGLLYLFLTPNPTDPLNKEAAELMLKDKDSFAKIVYQTMRAGTFANIQYDRVI